jgi:hypothetical protein
MKRSTNVICPKKEQGRDEAEDHDCDEESEEVKCGVTTRDDGGSVSWCAHIGRNALTLLWEVRRIPDL